MGGDEGKVGVFAARLFQMQHRRVAVGGAMDEEGKGKPPGELNPRDKLRGEDGKMLFVGVELYGEYPLPVFLYSSVRRTRW